MRNSVRSSLLIGYAVLDRKRRRLPTLGHQTSRRPALSTTRFSSPSRRFSIRRSHLPSLPVIKKNGYSYSGFQASVSVWLPPNF